GLLAAALVAATVAILGAQSVPARWPTRLLLLTGLAFSAALSWRASPTLAALNLSAAAVAFILTLPRPWRLASGLPRDYLALLAHWLGLAASGWFGLLSGERFPGEAAAAARNRISRVGGLSSVLRASLVALPLLVVFGALMSSADAAFASALGRVFAFPVDATEAVRRVMLSLVYSYLFAGHLHGLARVAPATAAARAGWAGRTEIIVILGSVAALFLAFVLVQVGYLFGGAGGARVAGLTYAEYARRGFFELVLVTALVLPLLTVGHGQVRREEPGAERAFRLLATTLLVLLIVIVASAFRRLGAYTEAFGLTELRLYTAAFMAWLVLVLAWFGLTVLRGQDRRLAAGALAAGFLCLGALNLANPDGLIVRVNTARAVGGSQLDATYLATLSADAVPALRAALPTLPAEDKRVINAALARFRTEAHGDWRSWNLAHANAADD
ncbi:MAG TPA: DUF4173 domain-containing protein, partial [Deinococcales bacterium]|nr:DUF4173 domain-containing protein [Deinococcales bacterium]